MTIAQVLSLSPEDSPTVTVQGKVTYLRPFGDPLDGAFIGLQDDTGKIQVLGAAEDLPLYEQPVFRWNTINIRVGDTVCVEGTLSLSEKKNLFVSVSQIRVVERRELFTMHFATEMRPDKTCERCGRQFAPNAFVIWSFDAKAYANVAALREAGYIACIDVS